MNANLLTVAQLSELTEQDETLLRQFGSLSAKLKEHNSNRFMLLGCMICVGVVAMMGSLSMLLGLFIFFILLPMAVSHTKVGRKKLLAIGYEKAISDKNAANFEAISAACQKLSLAPAIYVRPSMAAGSIRQAGEINLNDLPTKIWSIGSDDNALYFFPDRIIIKANVKHAMVLYKKLQVSLKPHESVLNCANPAMITFALPEGPFFEILVSDSQLAQNFCNSWRGGLK